MSKKSFRVYVIEHLKNEHEQRPRVTTLLMRTQDHLWFEELPLAAHATTLEHALEQLAIQLRQLEVTDPEKIAQYLWEETLLTQQVSLDIYPQSLVDKQPVIGKIRIPLRLTYAYYPIPKGGYRIFLPRFLSSLMLEELELAPEVLRNTVSSFLLGKTPRWVYDFRQESNEYVLEWSPKFLLRVEAKTNKHMSDEHEEFPTLYQVADNWVTRSKRGKLTPTLGDSLEFEANVSLFSRDPQPSILLVGPTGVGKTTWVRRLAKHLALTRKNKNEVPKLWATSADKIIAGMVYLGMWQERCLKIVNEISLEGDYLYVDRLWPLLQPQPDGASIADIFASSIASGEMSVIAECSESELEQARHKYPSLIDHFQIIRLEEPSFTSTLHLLHLYQSRLGSLQIHAAGLRCLIQYLTHFQRDRAFPGKGFQFLDWLVQESSSQPARTLYAREISQAYARYSGLPLEIISDEYSIDATTFSHRLKQGVIGQDQACDACARMLARLKVGLNDPEKPCGSFLFVGPTGVGKTELAKQLARTTFGSEQRMIRLDMSEYMFRGSASRLLDTSPGVISLASQVRQQPLSLILFDEIEKAHPEVFDLLLGVLGEGRLNDSSGRFVDFRMTMIVMTSNLGVKYSQGVGFGANTNTNYVGKVREHFRPEFFNRIDAVLSFRALTQEDVVSIVDLELIKASQRSGLHRRNLRLHISNAAKAQLAFEGYHPTRGARPLKRRIEETIITPLAARISADSTFRERIITILAHDEQNTSIEDSNILQL